MSIYPVKLFEWYPRTTEICLGAMDIIGAYKCLACGKRPNYKKAIGDHSVPFGYGDVWCSKRCFKSKRIHRLDKRQRRKNRRILKDLQPFWDNLHK